MIIHIIWAALTVAIGLFSGFYPETAQKEFSDYGELSAHRERRSTVKFISLLLFIAMFFSLIYSLITNHQLN